MAEENAEVRVRLVADDLSEAVVAGVMASMKQLREEQEKATKAAGAGEGLTGSLIKANVVTDVLRGSAKLVTESIHQAYEMTEKLADAALEAADAQEKQTRAMAGNLFLIDQGRHGMAALRDYSADMREEFAKTGVEMGVTTASITEAFNQLVSRGTMGSEKAKDMAVQMAEVGKIVPGGMEALSQGFSMVELGMVRAKNPIVQLIAATHTLKGNAHEIAAAMQKMTPEQQMALGEKAIAAQAEALKKMGGIGPATLPELRTSFDGVKEGFLESMGKPIEDALIPHLTALRNFLADHIETIKHYGEVIGRDVGEVIDYVSNVVQGMYEGFSQDWANIESVFDDLFGDWNRAWETARKNSGEIRSEFRDMAAGFVGLMRPILAEIKAIAEVAMDANDILHGRAAGTSQSQIQMKSAQYEALNATGGSKSMAEVDDAIRKYRILAKDAGYSGEQVEAYADSLRATAEANMKASDQAKSALEGGNYDAFNSYVDSAIKSQSDGAEEYAFKLLQGSEEGRRALLAGADHIGGGLDELMKVIGDKSPELLRQMKELQGGRVGKEGITPPQHATNFYGAHFDIKQSFADSDPDRILVMFTDKLTRAARNRIESRVATPFGL